MPLPDHRRCQLLDFTNSELGANKRVRGNFEAIERFAATAFVIGDVVVEAAIDDIGSDLLCGIEGGEPSPRLGLGARVVENALAVGVEYVIGGTEPRFAP